LAVSGLAVVFIITPCGCSQYIDPNVPEPIRPFVEPELGGKYLLYRPSAYDRGKSWPLIVVCHSSPFDSPNERIRAWTQLAESHGFLVVAPKLKGTARHGVRRVAGQIALQREDEERILAAVRNVGAGHSISEDRIFIHGWSGGALAALYTGLRHPDLFRAIALSQPGFKEGFLADADAAIDVSQPVSVGYSFVDVVTGKDARKCVEWLQTHGVNAEVSTGPVRPSDARRPVQFFEEVIRKVPWLHIRAYPVPGGDPLEVQFKLRCTEPPSTYHWDFGDGEESVVAEPVHRYKNPGTYRITLAVEQSAGRMHHRAINLKLPEATVTPAGPQPATP
jgi:predicted esterase